jgi:hypothetical protein
MLESKLNMPNTDSSIHDSLKVFSTWVSKIKKTFILSADAEDRWGFFARYGSEFFT